MLLSLSSAVGQSAPTGPEPIAPPPAAGSSQGRPTASFADVVGLLMALAGPVSLVVLWRLDIIRPGSFRRSGVRDPGPWPWWLWVLSGFVVLFTQAAFAGLAVAWVGGPATSLRVQVAAGSAGAAAGVAAAAVLVRMLAGASPDRGPESGLDLRLRGRDVAVGLLALAAAYPVVQATAVVASLGARIVRGTPPESVGHETLRLIQSNSSSVLAWVLGLLAVLGAPVIEEILFRVFLQTAALRLTGRVWLSILVTSVLFAAVHLGGGVSAEEAHVLAPLFVLGVAMGIAYERTRRPVVPITMHMAFNAINLALLAIVA